MLQVQQRLYYEVKLRYCQATTGLTVWRGGVRSTSARRNVAAWRGRPQTAGYSGVSPQVVFAMFSRTETAREPAGDDANGNLTNDGLRSFQYDDENQLISVWATNSWKTDFAYDGLRRRRAETNYVWSSASAQFVKSSERHFVYDGNLVIEERDANNRSQVFYTRGRDLSGSLSGAGGVGGLLARTPTTDYVTSSSAAHAYYFADGNGNVTMLIGTNQLVLAKYLYDSFGNTVSKSGPLADINFYRFSSKELHLNNGLIYFARRFYDPNSQRWISRDPLFESGGMNLYGFAGNSPINQVDSDGRFVLSLAFLVYDAGRFIIDAAHGESLGADGAWVAFDLGALAVDAASAGTGGEGMELASAGARGSAMAARALEADRAAFQVGKVSAADAVNGLAHLGSIAKVSCPYKGGKYGDIKNPSGDELDAHHMPAKQASPLHPDDGPAIQMDPADHRETASYGGGPGSPQQAYRDAQQALINQGNFDDAFLMDVDDITSKFPGKYDDAILEAIDALPKPKK